MKLFLTVLLLVFAPMALFAQDVVSDSDWIAGLIQNLSNVKDMKTTAIVLLVLQSIFSLSKTPMGGKLLLKVTPDVRWAITTLLGIIVPAMTLVVVNGTSWGDALLGGGMGMVVLNFGFQVYERFFKKK